MQNNTVRTTLRLNWSIPLAVMFTIFKLCHVIEWPWVWVLSPMWISFIVHIIIIVAVALIRKEK